MSENVVAKGRFDLQGRLMKGFAVVDEILERLLKDDDPDRQLAAIAEHRKHVALAERVWQTAIRAEAVAEFQAFVLETLEGASVKVRRKVMGLFEVQSREE